MKTPYRGGGGGSVSGAKRGSPIWVFLISKRWSIQIRRKRRMRVEAYSVEACW
ncbi:hypothetical protein RchiOBHm_Chr7g0198151 [Rosa chinensis]|uniref:Uncharacterized protein n=1 Tax=Rosa chinensis TaxID=74649 RepID=A0A2P6P724_ROSCH|nr:hypothetical protein RchiOBHm_Chr7g0198151 [Rosa chinensis]